MRRGYAGVVQVPTLAGDGVVLRPWTADDAAWYVGSRDQLVFEWTRESAALTVAEAEANFVALAADPARGGFAIADPMTGELMGNLSVTVHDEAVELSYWVAPQARGRGVAGAALATGAFWAANTFGTRSLELVTHPANTGSQRVAEKAGFVATGIRPSSDDCADERGMVTHYQRLG